MSYNNLLIGEVIQDRVICLFAVSVWLGLFICLLVLREWEMFLEELLGHPKWKRAFPVREEAGYFVSLLV